VKHVFEANKGKIMEITDEDRLQPYMVKEVYVDAVLAGNFFPNI
jgi:hypothetical protein